MGWWPTFGFQGEHCGDRGRDWREGQGGPEAQDRPDRQDRIQLRADLRKLRDKVSLQWLYDNEPALTGLPLFATEEPVGDPIGEVMVPVDELDTIFRASMVVNI